MKHILTIWLLMFAVNATFSQSYFKYVLVAVDDNAYHASLCRQIESDFYQIGIRPIKLGDLYKDFSINPYQVIDVAKWSWSPFNGFYVELY